ncbi:FG-GAP-like repeat-containing protein [Singulisphaera rosea]
MRRRRRLSLEVLEGRTLLASSVLVDGLEFTGNFTQSGQSYTSTGTVLIGYAPTESEAFNPLLSTDGLVTVANPEATSFTIAPAENASSANLSLYSLTANPTFWTTTSTATFNISDLTSTTGQSLGAGSAQALTVADIPFDATNLSFTIPSGSNTSQAEVLLQGNLDFTSIGLSGLEVGVGTAGDGNNVVVTTGSSASMILTGVEASLDASFTAYGVTIGGQITAAYSADTDTFSFGGSVSFSADGMVNVSSSLGNDTNVVGGIVQEIGLELPSSFDLFGLELVPQGLTFEYTFGANQFEMYGAVTASVSGSDPITATMGSASDPGLVVDADTGDVAAVNMSISGTFNLLGLQIACSSSNPPTLVYSAATDDYEISGNVTVPTLFNASVTLGTQAQPGLTIDDGNWSVDNLQIGLSDVQLGAFEIQQFIVDYTQTSSTVATVDVTLELSFPEGWDVTGSLDLSINEATGLFSIEDISLAWQADSTGAGIPIGDTGLFLTEMSADVQNIDQPSNLLVSGTMEVVFGKQVTIFGQQASFFQVDGSFFADKDELSLSANVLFGAVTSGNNTTGLLGTATGSVVLDWDDADYSLSATSSMLDGAFTYDASFSFNDGGDILLSATADVNVPDGVPLIGGQKLGSLSFLFEYEPPATAGGQAQGFIAAWTSIDLYVTTVSIGFEYNYVNDQFIILGSGAINNLENQVKAADETYTYTQTFQVPTGATQGTLEVDWTGNSVLAALTPTLSVESSATESSVSVTPSTTGTITLLQGTGLTNSTQYMVGIVGSTTNPYAGLAANSTYTLSATFNSSTTPTNTTADISQITEGSSSSEILVTFASGSVPSGLQVGDIVTLAGTGSDSYNSSSTSNAAIVQSITSSGIMLNVTYDGDATGGTLSGWTLPQFNASWYIPPPTISINPLDPSVVQSGSLNVTLPVQVASTLASNATVSIYIAPYNSSLGTAQAFNGTLLAQNIPLNDATTNSNSMNEYTATATVDLSGLLPIQYYLYAVVNDGTNTPVTSSLTGTDQVMQNQPVISGEVTNQNGTDLSGWTVNAVVDGTVIASTTTNSSGFYGFYSSEISAGTAVDIELVNLDSTAFSFQDPSVGTEEDVTYVDGTTTTVNFTVTQSATIEGIAFEDANQSGNPVGQTPLAGWTVFLDTNGNGQLDSGEQSMLTSATGAYAFYGLTPGTTYTVDLVSNTGASAIYSFEASTVSGTSVYDVAGDPNATQQIGTLTGGASVVSTSTSGSAPPNPSGSSDHVLSLDGSTGYLSVPGNSTLQPGSGGFTVGAWINGNQTILGANNPTIAGTTTSGTASGGWNLGLTRPLTFSNSSIQPSLGEYGYSTYYNADFNDDGKPDILAVNTTGPQILLNTTPAGSTTPTFRSAYSYSNSNAGLAPAIIADFNGDGMPDFALSCANGLIVFLNTTTSGSSTITFQADTLVSGDDNWDFGPLVAVTLNGSSQLPDIAVAIDNGASLRVFMNNTVSGSDSLSFTSQTVTLGESTVLNQVVVGDFNGDGSPDLAITSWDASVLVLINTTVAGATTASFGAPTSFTIPNDSLNMAAYTVVGDFNDDGKVDLAISEGIEASGYPGYLDILLSTTATSSSTASFSMQSFSIGSGPYQLVVADLNDDGLPDIAVTNDDESSITVLLNTTSTDSTTASFSSATYTTGTYPQRISLGDFNGDGSPDLAVFGTSSEPLNIFLNETADGSSTPDFTSSSYAIDSSGTWSMVVADFNGDGLDDVASSYDDGNSYVTTDTTQTNLTAEVQEDPTLGSGSFSTQSPASVILNSNTWYYVAFTYEPDVDSNGDDELTLYVNGVQVAQSIGLGTLPSSAAISGGSDFDMLVGAQGGSEVSQFFGGYVGDLSIWPSALTSSQILALYGGGLPSTIAQTTPTDPGTYTETISNATEVVAGDNFGEVPSATIIGTVSGIPLDSSISEPLSGWAVELLDSSNQVVATTLTGSTGFYFFYGILPGTYTIQEVAPSGWTPSGDATLTVTTVLNTVYPNENFTNTQTAQITGVVYVDANNDGIQDDGEVGLPGATVYIDENQDGRLDDDEPTAVTNAEGAYAFTGLAPGQYIVRAVSSPVGVPSQPLGTYYLADVSAHGTVGDFEFGFSPLVIAPIANVTVNEGTLVSFVVGLAHSVSGQPTFFYLEPGAPAGATINPITGLVSWRPTSPGTYTIGVATNAAGTPLATDSRTFTIQVNDVAPVVHLGSDTRLTVGDPFHSLGSFSDPGTAAWTATVDYGDGKGPQALLLSLDRTFELNHVYQDPGAYSVTVVVNDGQGGIGSATMHVVVLSKTSTLVSGFGSGRDAFVTSLFETILKHAPDLVSLSFWSRRLRAGASQLFVARRIWRSPEHHVSPREKLTLSNGFTQAYKLARQAEFLAETHVGAPAKRPRGK